MLWLPANHCLLSLLLQSSSSKMDAKVDRLVDGIKLIAEEMQVHECRAITMRAIETVPKLASIVGSGKKVAHLAAAALHYACREAGAPRTFDEVSSRSCSAVVSPTVWCHHTIGNLLVKDAGRTSCPMQHKRAQ